MALNFGTPEQINLEEISSNELRNLIEEGHFAQGSMLPKVEAVLQFIDATKNKVAIIASLESAKEALKFKTGTIVRN